MNRLIPLSCLVLLVVTQAFAQIRLPAIIGDHMVLQQKSEVKLWGWCGPSDKVSVRTDWDTVTYRATGTREGKWQVTIKTPGAGGPYRITLSSGNTVVLNDVMTGEVWVCSGQSNMEWSGTHGLKQSLEEMPNATNTKIRFFHIPKSGSEFPQEDVKASWVVCNPEDMKKFSAIGYFFGKRLVEDLNTPVGMINSSWGGTPAEVWAPAEVVESDPALKAAAGKVSVTPWWPVLPGHAYNAMIAPITNYRIAGALWYQGESNTGTWSTYQALFTNMIGAWRKAWGTEFPFYYVQIAPYAGYGNYNICPLLRDVQTRSLSYPRTGMVVVSDLVDNIDDIHPQLKKEVAARLASLALSEAYGKTGLVYKYPMYKSMAVEKDKIRISFENAGTGLTSKGGSPTEFYIAGEDRKFLVAQAKIEKGTVLVWSKEVKKPVAVRFGFSNAAMPNLFSAEGMPVNLFRTDDWEIDTRAVEKK